MEMFPGDGDDSIRNIAANINDGAPESICQEVKQKLSDIDKIIDEIKSKYEELATLIGENEKTLTRLEDHGETLKNTLLQLAKKIDAQTLNTALNIF
ncbi:IMv membrane protein [Cetacean poxvirus 1]|nr:IMv membrane protein [Cetacean poxvirus 1]